MGLFSKKALKSENGQNKLGGKSLENNNNNKWIYTVKYNSFFETFKYPNPADFFFGVLGLSIGFSNGFESAFVFILIIALVDGYFWHVSGGNKIILTEQAVASNMWTKVGVPYTDIISCEIRDTNTLIIKSKIIGNFYLHDLHMFEFERIKSIVDEKIKLIENKKIL
jgi:hypothetical protein